MCTTRSLELVYMNTVMHKISSYYTLHRKIFFMAAVAVSFVAGMSLVYFTPLKYSQLVEPKIHDIDPRDIQKQIAENPDKFDFIDVRGVADYANVHATGARNIPLYMMYFERHNLPKTGKQIVLICSKGTASGVAYMYLQHFGFQNVVRVEGGIENWQAFNLPTVSNAK